MVWTVEMTDEARRWYDSLNEQDMRSISNPIDELRRRGPMLGRPLADRIRGSRHHNMKELRSIGGHIRALYVFDPRRRAIILLGGDKSGDWKGWYRRNIPRADALYDDYLRKIDKKEGTR